MGVMPHRPKLADIKNDSHLISMWLSERERKSTESLRAYRRDVERFVNFSEGKAIALVNFNDLQEYQQTLIQIGYKQATINRYMNAIKSLLSFGFKLGYLPFNVGAIVRLPDPKNCLPERILDVMQVMNIIALEPNPRNKLIMRFLFASGGRVSEVCSLTYKDLKAVGDRGQVTFYGKGGKSRTVALNKSIWKEIQQFKPADATPDSPLFPSRKRNEGNGGLQPSRVRKIIKAAGERVGIKGLSPHWFRHTHATVALENGSSIQLLKQSLGHSSIVITERYLHAKPHDSSSMYLPF